MTFKGVYSICVVLITLIQQNYSSIEVHLPDLNSDKCRLLLAPSSVESGQICQKSRGSLSLGFFLDLQVGLHNAGFCQCNIIYLIIVAMYHFVDFVLLSTPTPFFFFE